MLTLRALLVAAVFATAVQSVAAPQPATNASRHSTLANIIDRNVGHAHMRRGVNTCTILALNDAVTDQDISVLAGLLESVDPVHRLAAGYVLSVMGPLGTETLLARGVRLGPGQAKEIIAHSETTKKALDEYRRTNGCRQGARPK